MARDVRWTEIAWSDLEAVSQYIAKDSRYYASAFVRKVRDAARSLAYLAERGRIVPELGQVKRLVRGYSSVLADCRNLSEILPKTR